MKANPWLLPGAALLITGGWIVSGKQSAATLEREITVLTERIQQARAGGENASDEAAAKSAKDKDARIDWKDIGGKMAKMRGGGGMGDMRTYMRLQKLLLEMSAEELGAQLDEIAALDLDDSMRKQLRGMILGVLADKDPKMVLERFSDELNDEEFGGSWHLQVALGKLADTDPAAAVAWLDRQIAAGKFVSKSLDGKNPTLLRMENALVSQLLKTNPAAATARVAALPEDQREEFFQQGSFVQAGKEADGAMAKLIRDSLPADKVGKILADQAGNLSMQGGYDRVDGFIASANASDEEKSAIVSKVMESQLTRRLGSKIKAEDLDKARAWGATQSPATVDKATGEVLAGTLWRGGKFEDTSALVLQYHESSGNDDVLVAFLKSDQVRNRSAKEAMALIDQVKDPALRAEIQELSQYKNQSTEP